MTYSLRSLASAATIAAFAFFALGSGSKGKDAPKPAESAEATATTATAAAPAKAAAVTVAPEAKAFFDSLGDSEKSTAAFKKFAKPGVKDGDLTLYDFNNGVEVVSSKVDGKATCYEIHNKVPIGYHSYEVCFEGAKISKATYLALK